MGMCSQRTLFHGVASLVRTPRASMVEFYIPILVTVPAYESHVRGCFVLPAHSVRGIAR